MDFMLLAAQVPAEGPSPTSVFAWVMAAFFLWAWTMDAIGIHAISAASSSESACRAVR